MEQVEACGKIDMEIQRKERAKKKIANKTNAAVWKNVLKGHAETRWECVAKKVRRETGGNLE